MQSSTSKQLLKLHFSTSNSLDCNSSMLLDATKVCISYIFVK